MEKRIYRSKTNRIIGGVCGGVGDYLGIDPVLVRLLWVGSNIGRRGASVLFDRVDCHSGSKRTHNGLIRFDVPYG